MTYTNWRSTNHHTPSDRSQVNQWIKKFLVTSNDKHLLGCEFHYVCHDGKKHTGHNAMKHKHHQHHTGVFTIDNGMYIKCYID